MDGVNCLDAFDLDDGQVFDQQVNSVSQIESLAFIHHGEADLRVHVEAAFAEFVGQARMIGTLQEAGAEDGMHFHRGADSGGGDLVYFQSWNDGWAGHDFIFSRLASALNVIPDILVCDEVWGF